MLLLFWRGIKLLEGSTDGGASVDAHLAKEAVYAGDSAGVSLTTSLLGRRVTYPLSADGVSAVDDATLRRLRAIRGSTTGGAATESGPPTLERHLLATTQGTAGGQVTIGIERTFGGASEAEADALALLARERLFAGDLSGTSDTTGLLGRLRAFAFLSEGATTLADARLVRSRGLTGLVEAHSEALADSLIRERPLAGDAEGLSSEDSLLTLLASLMTDASGQASGSATLMRLVLLDMSASGSALTSAPTAPGTLMLVHISIRADGAADVLVGAEEVLH